MSTTRSEALNILAKHGKQALTAEQRAELLKQAAEPLDMDAFMADTMERYPVIMAYLARN